MFSGAYTVESLNVSTGVAPNNNSTVVTIQGGRRQGEQRSGAQQMLKREIGS